MKKAIALIELIFAIVVIAITLLSVPNLIETTIKSSNNAITQEAISNGASHLAMVISQYWDENDSNTSYGSPILYVNNGDTALNEARDSSGNLLGIRIGSNKETPRRFGVDSNGKRLKASKILGMESSDNNFRNDIDDYNGYSYTLKLQQSGSNVATGEFKDVKVNISTKVEYISDLNNYSNQNIVFNTPFNAKNSSSTNIKAITVTVTSLNDPNKKIVFKSFSCNIGSQKLNEKDF